MVKIATDKEYLDLILSLPRPGEQNYLAFYEHRLGAIFTNPRLLLLPMDDHLVHRGDGAFEALKCVDGRIYQLDEHLWRLQSSCKIIDVMLPCPLPQLKELILEVARAAKQKDLLLTVYVGQGPGGFTVDSRECPAPSLYIVARKFKRRPESFWEKGVSAFKSAFLAQENKLSRVKSVNYLRNAMMKREAVEKGYDYPLCYDRSGILSEGAAESVLIVNDKGQLLVPECMAALPGTTMRRALDLIRPEISWTSWPVSEDMVRQAKEVILLGTSLDAVSIVRYRDRPVYDARPGKISKRIRELLIQDLQQNGEPV